MKINFVLKSYFVSIVDFTPEITEKLLGYPHTKEGAKGQLAKRQGHLERSVWVNIPDAEKMAFISYDIADNSVFQHNLQVGYDTQRIKHIHAVH